MALWPGCSPGRLYANGSCRSSTLTRVCAVPLLHAQQGLAARSRRGVSPVGSAAGGASQLLELLTNRCRCEGLTQLPVQVRFSGCGERFAGIGEGGVVATWRLDAPRYVASDTGPLGRADWACQVGAAGDLAKCMLQPEQTDLCRRSASEAWTWPMWATPPPCWQLGATAHASATCSSGMRWHLLLQGLPAVCSTMLPS